ncbi:PadR family transcriptional regulator [Streptomyces roseolus]|uniref:PadR family transcriptional regulator n=1 Tax=Streptomyces roseolus TaxID=67358 RepID=UPI0019A1DDE4|nr:PadR family transcriptional regulator [Streptomyces roseolus]GGR56448.1 hypothetical protein GCM10010282_56830 [Streptomyces roseolus]
MPEVRLTTPSFLALGIIDALDEASPYDVKVAAARTAAPFRSVPHAQVYARCDRLPEAGLLSEARQEGGRNRRSMRLTEEGAVALRGRLADPFSVPVEARERGILKLRSGASPRVHAPALGARTGARRRRRDGGGAPVSAPGRRPGREPSAAVAVMGTVVDPVSLGAGALLAVAALTGHAAGTWASPEALGPGLIGAAMVGVAPALPALGRPTTGRRRGASTRLWSSS